MIKPVGEKRDKQVAVLRDTQCMYRSEMPIEFEGKSPCCMKSSIAWPNCATDCLMFKHKPWSTDIASAMELWEEMFTPQFHNLCVWYIYISGFCPSKSNPKHYFSANIKNKHGDFKYRTGNVRHDTVAKAMADAISGAYVKWRTA